MATDMGSEDQLKALIFETGASASKICSFLDALPEAERIAATRSLGRRAQRKLWQLVDGFAELTLEHFVPTSTPLLTPVRHFGRNTLPAFVLFEKRFYRMGDGSLIGGANFQDISWLTGPGYFVTSEDKDKREVLVDYRDVPKETPASWPKVVRNEVGISRFIYGFMIDRMRRVSEHVTIGRANRGGKDVNAWFMLCKQESR